MKKNVAWAWLIKKTDWQREKCDIESVSHVDDKWTKPVINHDMLCEQVMTHPTEKQNFVKRLRDKHWNLIS